MNIDTNTLAGSTAAPPHGGLLNAALLSIALLSAALLSAALLSALVLGGCEGPLGGGISESGGGENVTLTFGKSDGRAITSGVDLPADVLASMRFEAKLAGPNGESLSLNATWGETAKLKLRQGKWRIDAKAYQADSPNLAGTGSLSFEIQAKNNKIIVPMVMRDTAGAPLSCYEISVPGFANGQVEASFTAAYPGTTVTLTTAPAGGYILHSLTYSDGTGTYTPGGGGNEYVFTMPDADVTVSAVFTHPFYTITYSAGTGSGTVPAPVVIESGTSIPLPAGSAPSGGIPFYSWEVDGTAYAAGASYTVTGDVTLTARWAFSSVSDIPAYLNGMSGGSETNPIPLPAGIASVDTAWDALLGAIPTGKFVALDLSISTISGTVFNPASTNTGKTQIVSLVLPDTALSIANGTSSSDATFKSFSKLKRVAGAGVTGVSQYVFHNNTVLTEVSLPAATSISDDAFSVCTALATVSLPAATSIGNNAFYGCAALATVSLPAATSIGMSAFSGCPALATVSLPAATTISDDAFTGCIALLSVSFPAAVSIGTQAFTGCTALLSVSLPAATIIGDRAFNGCTALLSVSLPAATTIGNNAFSNCAALATVSLPAVTTIGNSAFSSTTGVTPLTITITMGSTAPTVGTGTFGGTSGKNVIVKVPSTASYDATWQTAFKNGSSITLSIETL